MEELYIVTGAAGFLGSTIVRQLVEKNKRVRAFVLPNDKSVEYLPWMVFTRSLSQKEKKL